MHPINLGLIFIAGLNVGLALLIWLRNPKHKINITFALAIFLLGIWSFGMAMFREASTETAAWIWAWVQNGFGSLVVIPFYIFSIYFPYQDRVIKYWHLVLILLSIIITLTVVIVPGFWIEKINLSPSNNSYTINRLGLFYFNLYFLFYLFLTFYNLIKKYRKSEGFIKNQLSSLLWTTGVMAIFGSFFNILFPLVTGQLGSYWIGVYFSLPMIIFLSHFVYKK